VRNRHTAAELSLRRALHRRGLRYRVNRRVEGIRSQPDIVFGPARVAVFVDGCFWHSCPLHATHPRANGEWWSQKLERNRERDRQTDAALRDQGWEVVRVWEHEDPLEAATRVHELVQSRRGQLNVEEVH